jgi:hypothetical protein
MNQNQVALSPAARDDAILDFSDKADLKKYENAIAKLNNRFDGKPQNMTVFKSDLKYRSHYSGWNNGMANSDIISIPIIADANVSHNLITEYSQLSEEDIRAWATTNVVGNNSRKAQNNAHMFTCIYNSLTANMINRMSLESSRHYIGVTPIAALFYKQLMGDSTVDTTATISLTRHQLATLDTKMIDLNSNIREFNIYVQELRTRLTQYGATSEDVLVNLFRGYKAARDNNFHKYINFVEQSYHYGDLVIDANQLMNKALTAYQVELDKGSWGELSKNEQMIHALQSEVKGLKDSKLTVDTGKKKGKGKGKGKGQSNQSNSNSGKQSKTSSSSGDQNYDWKNKGPASGASHTKKHSGKTYYWCPHHRNNQGQWVLHKISECRNKANADTRANAAVAAPATATSSDISVTPSTTFAAAAAAAAIVALNSDEE